MAVIPSEIIVFDTETTGLDPAKDEILSLSIIDGDGNVLFDDYLKPAIRKRWPKAAEIHGIQWADVKNKQTILERKDEIEPLFRNAKLVVGYNTEFDLRMLMASGIVVETASVYDVMKHYAITHNNGRYAKLTQCAKHYGYKFGAHNALEDAKATLHCYKALTEETKVEPKETVDDEGMSKGGCGCMLVPAVLLIILLLLVFR